MSSEDSEACDISRRSPIAIDIVRLLAAFRKHHDEKQSDVRTAFEAVFAEYAFQDIHFCMYRPFSVDPQHSKRPHFSDSCTDRCENHNDWLRVLYAHINAYFTLTSWVKNPLCWTFAIELLVAMHSTILLPHGCAEGDEAVFDHDKYRVPLSPHVIRQVRLFAEYCVEYDSIQEAQAASADKQRQVMPKLSKADRKEIVATVLAFDSRRIIRATPAIENWCTAELLEAHSALDIPVDM